MSENEEQWKEEAKAVIADICNHVENAAVSTLPCSNKKIFINLTTFEKDNYCIELTSQGFRIVGNRYDDNNNPRDQCYETPYSLLDDISPKYRESFGERLMGKLAALQEEESKK